jgi:hypothetical protein
MKMEKRYTKLLRSLNENFVAFDYDHEVLTHFQTKADGMKWKNHKNAPDSYYLVKTKHRLLKGDTASDGSDSLSKHLNTQPFPHRDGPHYSVHKESVLPSSIGTNWAPKEDRDRSDKVRDHELAMNHHTRQMSRDPENKKYHLQQAADHAAAAEAGAEVSRIAPGPMRDAANRDFERKSEKAHAGSVQHLGASVEVNEEMSPEVKARVASLHNTPSQIAARKAAAKNNMVRPGTEADLPKDHDWNDRDAYPKESIEMNKLDDELEAMRARMAEETQNEDYELTEEDLPEAWTPSMRRAAARRMKILAPRIKLGIKRSKNRTATKEKLMTRAVRKVKSDLIKKFTKGSSKTDLSAARRADMEKRIAKLGPRIKQLAQKQLPATRRMEADRKRNKNK